MASASSTRGGKTAHDSLHDVDGRSVTGSIALVEVQGYVFAAYRWLADVVAQYGDAQWATELRDRSDRVRRTVEDRFWLPEEGYYAQALDEQKRPVAAISSNPGHLLYCELPSPERGRLVAARLRQPDLDSGWGVRTLAASMATYNPMSYHNGSVWPHDNSLIAAGLGRYGETRGLERIASALFAEAEHLPVQPAAGALLRVSPQRGRCRGRPRRVPRQLQPASLGRRRGAADDARHARVGSGSGARNAARRAGLSGLAFPGSHRRPGSIGTPLRSRGHARWRRVPGAERRTGGGRGDEDSR